jgi:hypothetical protein
MFANFLPNSKIETSINQWSVRSSSNRQTFRCSVAWEPENENNYLAPGATVNITTTAAIPDNLLTDEWTKVWKALAEPQTPDEKVKPDITFDNIKGEEEKVNDLAKVFGETGVEINNLILRDSSFEFPTVLIPKKIILQGDSPLDLSGFELDVLTGEGF